MPFSGERLREARQEVGLNQTQLSQRLGITMQQVSRWEQQTAVPGADMVAQLGTILGCTTDWLLGLVDNRSEHLYDSGLSQDERELILLYRRGELPDLIQRLVIELAEGGTVAQKDPVVDHSSQPNVSSSDIPSSR